MKKEGMPEKGRISFSERPSSRSVSTIFFDMVGFRMPDGVVFLADCIGSKETLDMVERMEAAMFKIYMKELKQYGKIRRIFESIGRIEK